MTLASHARGPQFNPGTEYYFSDIMFQCVYAIISVYMASQCSLVVERLLRKQKVAGSIPVVGFILLCENSADNY